MTMATKGNQAPTIYKYVINRYLCPAGDFKYNVQRYTSVDGGKSFWYCGNGTFTKTLADAETWVAEQTESAVAAGIIVWE